MGDTHCTRCTSDPRKTWGDMEGLQSACRRRAALENARLGGTQGVPGGKQGASMVQADWQHSACSYGRMVELPPNRMEVDGEAERGLSLPPGEALPLGEVLRPPGQG